MISDIPDGPSPRPRGRPRTRVELEDVPRLHLPSLLADGCAIPGETVSSDLAWSGPDGRRVAVRVVVELKERHGQVIVYPPGARCYVVQVTSDRQPFGGRRWWLICPVLKVAASALYLPPGADRFASRQAHGLGYRSQRLGRRGRGAAATG